VGDRWGGKVVVVTGAASGIGRALATRLHDRGAVVVLADLDGTEAESAAEELGTRAHGLALDVTDGDAVVAAVDEVEREQGPIDLLINNAGISLGGRSHEMPVSHWQRTIDVNLGGVVNGVVAAYPRMVERGQGQIVNVASMAGLAPTPLTVAYTASKHGVVGLSTTLRIEAKAHGVKVNVLCPGSIETPILDKGPPADLPPSASSTLSARQFLEAVHQKPTSLEAFATRALRGIERDTAVIIAPASGKALWWFQRASPTAFRGVAGVLHRRVERLMPDET
jgi:NAD(P)-dependent dehydrogenase (short-subunit alcohol dehydrogenase family)